MGVLVMDLSRRALEGNEVRDGIVALMNGIEGWSAFGAHWKQSCWGRSSSVAKEQLQLVASNLMGLAWCSSWRPLCVFFVPGSMEHVLQQIIPWTSLWG